MSGVAQGIFGGSKSKQKSNSVSNSTNQSTSESLNQAFPWAQQTYGSQAQTGVDATAQLRALLGLGGDRAGADAAFDSYQKNSGLPFILSRGSQAITGNRAASGLLDSGATGKRLMEFGQETGSKYYNDYLDRLLGISANGMGAGNLITGAGNRSNSQSTGLANSVSNSTGTSSSKPGIAGFLGSAMASASDRRLKTEIELLGETEGLGVYSYRYNWDEEDTRRVGYMADEVERLFPEALGPELTGGYQTVYYDRLPSLENIYVQSA
jgi:hypothetical protein